MIEKIIKLSQYLLTILVVAVIAVSITACGRKGMPERPADSVFPRSYPSQ